MLIHHQDKLISDFEDEKKNDVANNTNFGDQENDKEKSKKRVRRKKDEFDTLFSTFIDVYAENAKRKMTSLRKVFLVVYLVKLMRAKYHAKKMISMKTWWNVWTF